MRPRVSIRWSVRSSVRPSFVRSFLNRGSRQIWQIWQNMTNLTNLTNLSLQFNSILVPYFRRIFVRTKLLICTPSGLIVLNSSGVLLFIPSMLIVLNSSGSGLYSRSIDRFGQDEDYEFGKSDLPRFRWSWPLFWYGFRTAGKPISLFQHVTDFGILEYSYTVKSRFNGPASNGNPPILSSNLFKFISLFALLATTESHL